MPQFRGPRKDRFGLRLCLTGAEYRLLADLLLDHIGTDPVRNDQLKSLAQRLFVLAVQAEQHTP